MQQCTGSVHSGHEVFSTAGRGGLVSSSLTLSQELDELLPLQTPFPGNARLEVLAGSSAKMIQEMIIQNTLLHPSAVAIIEASTGSVHSYRQLHLAATAVADGLQQRLQQLPAAGAHQAEEQPPETVTIVAVMLPNGFARVAALLGCLLAGVAFVCLDPDWPEACRHLVLEHSSAAAVITSASVPAANSCLACVPEINIEALLHSTTFSSSAGSWLTATAPAGGRRHNGWDPSSCTLAAGSCILNSRTCFGDLMAISYSVSSSGGGSSGDGEDSQLSPVIEGWSQQHSAVLTSHLLQQTVLPSDVFACCSGPGNFQSSVYDLWLPLAHGASVLIMHSEVLHQPAAFAAMVAKHGITCACLSASTWSELHDSKLLESLSDHLQRVWILPPDRVVPVTAKHLEPVMVHMTAAAPAGHYWQVQVALADQECCTANSGSGNGSSSCSSSYGPEAVDVDLDGWGPSAGGCGSIHVPQQPQPVSWASPFLSVSSIC